ncbi:hypothetical protein ACS0TY_000512 [Phlomoides rotata]
MLSSEMKQLDGRVSMVQGASRGIGLELVKQLLEKTKEGNVVATCSNPSVATGLLELADRLDIHRLHLTNYTTIETRHRTESSELPYFVPSRSMLLVLLWLSRVCGPCLRPEEQVANLQSLPTYNAQQHRLELMIFDAGILMNLLKAHSMIV